MTKSAVADLLLEEHAALEAQLRLIRAEMRPGELARAYDALIAITVRHRPLECVNVRCVAAAWCVGCGGVDRDCAQANWDACPEVSAVRQALR